MPPFSRTLSDIRTMALFTASRNDLLSDDKDMAMVDENSSTQ
jgi:hypothetical protein